MLGLGGHPCRLYAKTLQYLSKIVARCADAEWGVRVIRTGLVLATLKRAEALIITHNSILVFFNPKGIASQSPGLPSLRGYPGSQAETFTTLKGLRSWLRAMLCPTCTPERRRNPVGVVAATNIDPG